MPGARKDTTPITLESPAYTGRLAKLGEYTVAFESITRDGDSSPFFKGLPDDRCPCPHWGVVLEGRLTFHYADHDETFEAGDAYYAPPGHLPECPAGTELITFSPTDQIEEVNAMLAANSARVAAER
ncbi:hypothetical protein [Sinomonas flava]|uniref:Cupin domain-containing protein n=1 Tax=Sinomonas flava TaxID=496857 RepID=A0ABN3C3H7_9MICC